MNTLIIFDLDGTLAETRADIAAAVNLVLESFGLKQLPETQIAGYVGGGREDLMTKTLRDSPEADHAEACEKFTEFYNQNLTVRTHLYDGVAETISALAVKKYHMAVLSNKPGDMCRTITSHFDLDKYLVTTMGGGDASTTKPDPEGLNEVVRRAEAQGFKRNDDNVWMIGDHHTDINVARNAGVRSVFCNYGFGDRMGLEADYYIDSFSELESLLG